MKAGKKIAAMCGLFAPLLLFVSAGPTNVRYTFSPTSGHAPLTVTFDGSTSMDANNISFDWDFGDGERARGLRVNHTFYKPGKYSVKLNAKLQNGSVARGEAQLVAEDAGPERAKMVVLPNTGTLLQFDATSASVIYAPVDKVNWEFDDGTTAEGANVQHEFAPGEHAVNLQIEAGNKMFTQKLSVQTEALGGNQKFEDEVLKLTNEARTGGYDCKNKKMGAGKILQPLRRQANLERAARGQAVNLSLYKYFDHTSLVDNSTVGERAKAADYKWMKIGENIAAGQLSPQTVVDGWLHSYGHCLNIMTPDFTELGVSYIRNLTKQRNYWVQVFGKPGE